MPITTPFFHATNSQTPDEMTHIASIVGVAKVTLPAVAGNEAQYGIAIDYNVGGGKTSKTLLYNTAALRDTDFTALVAGISTSL